MMFMSILVAASAAAAPQWTPLNSDAAKQMHGQMVVQTPTVNPTASVPAPVGRVLPAATMVSLTALEELSSKHIHEGERYQFAVINDVTEGGYVVIPRGSIATGVVSMKTGRAVGGKSGKFDITFESVIANGVRFPLGGVAHEEGKGNTLGALFGSIVISGHSAVLQPGQMLTAFTSAPTAY